MTATPGAVPHRRSLLDLGLAAIFVYMVLIGGTTLAEGVSQLRFVTGVISGALIVLALVTLRDEQFDRIDRFVVSALVLFSAAGVLSEFPRQSFDALLAAVGFAAAFLVARRVLREATSRRLFIACLISLSAVMTVATFIRWVIPAIEWWAGTGWQVVPPFNFELAGSPWGHRHDLTLFLVLLYPAWWVASPSRMRRALAIVVGALLVPVVLVDGSRAVWVAIAIASAVAAGPALARHLRASPTARAWAVGLTVAAIAALVVTGLGAALVQRGLSPTSFGWRLSMWGPLLDQWTSQPIAGSGPGSFPWVLQLTNYFDTNSWAPRHPDSAIFQVIPEAGLLGLAGLALIVAAFAPAVWRAESAAARWSLVAFAIACLGANPTDFAFLVVLAIGWAAYAAPRMARTTAAPLAVGRPARVVSLALLSIAGGAYMLTVAGSFAFDRARDAVGADDLAAAAVALDTAAALDPGLALYPRGRGTAAYLSGDFARAIQELQMATQLNPADDLAWRGLALVYLSLGESEQASAAIQRAVRLQRSDPANLLTSAWIDGSEGRGRAASETLAEVVQAWPVIVFSSAWDRVLPDDASTDEIVREAEGRWRNGEPIPELNSDQGIWLTTMTGIRDDETALEQSVHSPALSEALEVAIGCGDLSILDELDPAEQRSPLYWWLRVNAASRHESEDAHALRMAAIMGHPVQPGQVDLVLIPFNDSGFDRYGWGYRRPPIDWASPDLELPSPDGGRTRWLLRPHVSVADAGLDQLAAGCLEPG